MISRLFNRRLGRLWRLTLYGELGWVDARVSDIKLETKPARVSTVHRSIRRLH